jgi:hypothetical protein
MKYLLFIALCSLSTTQAMSSLQSPTLNSSNVIQKEKMLPNKKKCYPRRKNVIQEEKDEETKALISFLSTFKPGRKAVNYHILSDQIVDLSYSSLPRIKEEDEPSMEKPPKQEFFV